MTNDALKLERILEIANTHSNFLYEGSHVFSDRRLKLFCADVINEYKAALAPVDVQSTNDERLKRIRELGLPDSVLKLVEDDHDKIIAFAETLKSEALNRLESNTVDVEGLKRKNDGDMPSFEYPAQLGQWCENFGYNQAIDDLAARGCFGGAGWQPIETYDYENFPLVMLAGFITPSEYAQSNGSKPFWEISIGRCWHVNTRKFTGFLGQQPTHWMPLPAAPKKEVK